MEGTAIAQTQAKTSLYLSFYTLFEMINLSIA